MPDAEKNQQQPGAGICSWLWHDDREDYKAVLLWCQTKLNTGLFHAASIGPSVDDVQVHRTIEGERTRSVSFLVRKYLYSFVSECNDGIEVCRTHRGIHPENDPDAH